MAEPDAAPGHTLSICLINPKFEPSFWGYDFALPMMSGDKRCTPLYDRLAAAGRLDFSHPDVAFHPALMNRETLKAGYDALMKRLYEPDAYFARLFRGYAGSPSFRTRRQAMEREIAAPRRRLLQSAGGMLQLAKLLRAAWPHSPAYLRAWRRHNRPMGRDRIPLPAFIGLCAIHFHFFSIANNAKKGEFGTVSRQDQTWAEPARLPAAI
jgi:hypothetical protein